MHRRVGSIIVTALNDGSIVLPAGALVGIDEAGWDVVYHAVSRHAPFASAINGFLLQWPDRTVLIDTGAGAFMGRCSAGCRAVCRRPGWRWWRQDLILLTHHAHRPHGRGGGRSSVASFPRATLMADDAELAFWLDNANRSKTPASVQDTFDIAHHALALIATGGNRSTAVAPSC